MAVTSRGLVRNRTFCEGDNLEYLLRMPDESVDLIATDPPFNKNREFQGIGEAEGATFKDYWTWEEDVHVDYLAHVRQHWPALNEVIEAAYAAHSPSMAAFLAFMSVRLIEMHRILKPTGSIYLHCDHTANAYLRLMMDAIFGRGNFRNELVWHYRGGALTGASKVYPRKHDTLLYYTKSDAWTFNTPREGAVSDQMQRRWGRYAETDGVTVLYGSIKHEKAEAKRSRQRILKTFGREPVDSDVAFTMQGSLIRSVWIDIPEVRNNPRYSESRGYPTQKPLALYRRMIETSSNKGALVLDPFAGCATTCVAAEQLGRQWVGIDLSPKARGITLDRLKEECGEGTFWEKQVHWLTVDDLRPLKGGITASLSVPRLPERQQRNIPKGYKPEDVRRYLAGRDAQGMRRTELGNISCQGCGYTPPRLDYQDVDHITPQAKEGANAWINFCLLCGPCNRRKAHKLTIEELRAAIQSEGLVLDETRLVAMDADSIAKRDRAIRPIQ